MNFPNILVSCMLAAASAASSQPPMADAQPGPGHLAGGFGPPMGMHSAMETPPPMMMDLAQLQVLMTEISIDKAVSAKIIAIARTFLSSLDERIIKIQKEELNIKEELLKAKPDMQAIQNAVGKKSQVFSEIEFAQIKRDLEIKSLLSQEEYDRWKSAMKTKMKQMMPGLMGRFAPEQPGEKRGPGQK